MYFQNYQKFQAALPDEQVAYLIEMFDKNCECLIQTRGEDLLYEGHTIQMHMDVDENSMLDRVMSERKGVSSFYDKESSLIAIENILYQNAERIAQWLALPKEEREKEYGDANGKLAITEYVGGYVGQGIDANLNEVKTPLITVVLAADPYTQTFFHVRTAYPDITKDEQWINKNLKDTIIKKAPCKTGKNYRAKALESLKNESDSLAKTYWCAKMMYPNFNINYSEKHNAVFCNFNDKENEYVVKFSSVRGPVLGIKNKEGKYIEARKDDARIPYETKSLINDIVNIEKNINKDSFLNNLIKEAQKDNDAKNIINIPK